MNRNQGVGQACQRGGFSLVEMLVVISLIALLVAISMPAISRARESGRDAQCKSNLRQLGIGITQYADMHTTLCSGAWDWKHDGCPTEVGWVADLINQGILVDQLKCPSNTVQMHEQFQTLLTFDPTNNPCADSLGSQPQLIDGQWTMNLCRELGAISSPSSRASLLATAIEDGYNTNYVATWLLVRSDVRLLDTGALQYESNGCPPSAMNRRSTVGPMNRAHIGMTSIASTIIPMLACAQQADVSEGILTTEIGSYVQGIRLSEGVTDGPVDPDTMKLPKVSGGGSGYGAWGPVWSKAMQDYRDFGPVHGGGSCNVLFLDLSVASFIDGNRDGFLNNGFKASSTNKFADDTIELPASRIFSGMSVRASRSQKKR